MTWRNRISRGQSVLELAIVAPAILTLLIVVGDYARIFYAAQEVSNAARAGAQYGAQSLNTSVDTSGIQNAAAADGGDVGTMNVTSSTFCTCSGSTATVTCGPTACVAPANEKVFVSVSTSATFKPAVQWYLLPLPASIPLSSTAVLEVQQ